MHRDRRGSNMAEAAITLPVVMLVLMAVLNVSIAGAASVAASQAANYGARIGAVSTHNSALAAFTAANYAMENSGLHTGYSVDWPIVTEGDNGGYSFVAVHWTVPFYFSGLCRLFGGNCKDFSGTGTATWKKEGW